MRIKSFSDPAAEKGDGYSRRYYLTLTDREQVKRALRVRIMVDQELSRSHCGALCIERGKRKWSCELVIRSRMIIGWEHDGHLSWLVDAG
jgi:hypothetical protein